MLDKFLSLTPVIRAEIIISAILILATIIIGVIRRYELVNDSKKLVDRIKSWWVMIIAFFAVFAVKNIAVLFFGLVSFWAFKEFVTILKTRRADHKALFFAFLTIPIQFYWIFSRWYVMFLIFVPIYMFLFLPIVMILTQKPSGFLESVAKIQWGLIAFVYGLSHLPYLAQVDLVANTGISGRALVFFLVIITEMNDVFQYIWGKSLGKRKIVAKISPNKTWAGLIGGVITTSIFSLLFRFLTPFNYWQVMLVAMILGIVGFFGDIVMSAIKRDIGIKDFSSVIPGHGGMLDRVDSLCYTAPVFFHIVAYIFFPGTVNLF